MRQKISLPFGWVLCLIVSFFASNRLLAEEPESNSNAKSVSAEKPNVILFLVDDLGWQDTSVAFWKEKTLFQDHFRTPNVAKLASQGVRFSRAYSCSVCSPTRTSIMTGQNAVRHQVTNWTLYADKDQSGKTNRIGPPKDWNVNGLQPDAMTLPKILKSVGYTTIHCGKAHWGAYGTAGADPCKLGFDVNIAGHPAGAPGSYQGKDNYGNNADGTRKEPWGVPGLEKYHGTDTHLTDALAIEASDAIDAAVKESKPFFLYMAPYAVHAPIQEHPRFVANYRGKKYPGTDIDIPEVEAKYASMVEGYDAALGALLKKLEELGQAENTIIIFTSDNGGLSAHARGTTPYGTGKDTHNWPLREGKGSCYEGGIRVPLVVSWAKPNSNNLIQRRLPIQANSQSVAKVICDDYLPTICSWAGLKVERSSELDLGATAKFSDAQGEKISELTIDGIDISKFVLGEQKIPLRKLVFHYPHVWGPRGAGYQPHSCLIWGHYKLVYFYHSRRWECYDLASDIGESKPSQAIEKNVLLKLLRESLEAMRGGAPEILESAEYIDHYSNSPEPPSISVKSEEDRAASAGWKTGGNWLDQHGQIISMPGRKNLELVFLGDSITQSWGGPGRDVSVAAGDVWNKYYSKRKATNFGISGDRTQHLLWRIENGALGGMNPKVVVVLIGTNNLPHGSNQSIAEGIQQVVLRLEERRDRAKILLLGILPRGENNDSEFRAKIAEINESVSALDDGQKTFYLDVRKDFVDENGQANSKLFRPDFLHLTEAGYEQLAKSIEPSLKKLLNEK